MSWTTKYWDAVSQFYWSPQYLGLKSIPQRLWTVDGDTVSIPREMTNSEGPLYRRLRSGDDYWEYVRRQEETFNHIFDLTFAILPGDVVGDILNTLTSAGTGHVYKSFGRELSARFSWGEHDNITTPDGFFVAEDSILAVELKFNAKPSLDQLAKYVMLFVNEEMVGGQRANLDLLYIFNSDPDATFEKHVGVRPNSVGTDLLVDLAKSVSHKTVERFLQDHKSAFESALERINVHCIHWQDLSDALKRFTEKLSEKRGDRTLKRLIDGLRTEIADHPLSHVDSNELESLEESDSTDVSR